VKTKLLCLLPLLLTAACSPQIAPTRAIPTPAATATRTIPTAGAIPTRAEPPPPVVALSAPAVQQRFPLSDLPGAGRDPYSVAILGDKVYVANRMSNNIAVVQNNHVTKFIPVGKSPAALAVDPPQNRLFVSNAFDKTISLIVNDQVTLTQSIGAEVRALLFFEGRLYAGLDTKDGVLVLDPGTLQTQARVAIPNIFSVINLAGDPTRHRVYANAYEKIGVIDSATLRLVTVFPVKDSYYTMLVSPPDGTVLLAIYDSTTQSEFLTGFDPITGAARGRVKIGGDPYDSVSNTAGSRLYVANSYTNDVSVIDPQSMSIVTTIPVGMRPKGVALDEKAHRLYVSNSEGDNLSVVDTETNQMTAAIPLGMIPSALLANESAGRVYVANASTDSVFAIEGTRVVKEIPVGHHPIDLSRDERSNRLFVANQADGSLSIIDESSFAVRTTQPITRDLTTVAVDAAHARVFAGGVILDLNNLAPIGQLTMRGMTLPPMITPDFVRTNLNNNRIYANGGNGIPGSNGRLVTYSIDGDTLQQRGALSYSGNTSHFQIDPATNRVYLAGTHPMASTSALRVFDANDALVFSLSLPARTTGMAYNPQTHHLFLSHPQSDARSYGPPQTAADNTIQIFDTNSFGELTRLAVDSPGRMARLGNTIYVASSADGSITLIQDVAVPAPPSPTPTFTPSPYPTLPPDTPTPARAASATPRAATPPACAIAVAPQFAARWTPGVRARIGCPTEGMHNVNIATQPFERGTMFWREDEQRIYVLYADRTWAVFDDTWTNALSEDSCPGVTVPPGLAKPRRGFGKVWCDQSSVRARLGGASGAEQGGFVVPVQRFERGLMFGRAQGDAYVLSADNTWE